MDAKEFTEEENKILSAIIEKHITEYTSKTAIFSADSLHSLRAAITEDAIQGISNKTFHSVDVLLNLENVKDINFGFRINMRQTTE